MNKKERKAGFFAKAEGESKGWKERFATLMGGKPAPKQATAKLEIDDQGTGETMVFPDVSDVTEIVEGVTVEATDGTHVFETDGTTYTIEVTGGKVTSVVYEVIEAAEALSAETQKFVTEVAEALEANDAFRTEATAKIESLTSQLATALAAIDAIKKATGHAGDGMGAPAPAAASGTVKVNGRTIDLSKINLNKK